MQCSGHTSQSKIALHHYFIFKKIKNLHSNSMFFFKPTGISYEPACIHLDCVKMLGMALVTYFEKKVNFDDPSDENNILRCFH